MRREARCETWQKTYEGEVRREGPRNAAIFSLFDQMLMRPVATGAGQSNDRFAVPFDISVNSQ